VATQDETSEAVPASVGLLMDSARTTIVAGRDAGVEPRGLLLSQSDFDEVTRAKSREGRTGAALQMYGIEIYPSDHVAPGTVELIITGADA
jgi:hypothetical protein